MIDLSSRPFCSCDVRRVSLGYLSAGLRYTTRHCIWAEGEPARGFLHGYGAALGALRQSQDDDGCCPQGAGTYMDPHTLSRGSRMENTLRNRCSHISGL